MTPRSIGPFQLERQIGVGGMGIVYSAIYPKTKKRVAVKVLSPGLVSDPKLLKRFDREIEILKRLNHPNIVKYYGGGTANKQRYYAMEFLDNGSLLDQLKKRGRLTWEQAINVGRQVASALEHAHNAGIIHRDLKPANLFLSKTGKLKLGDFGIARDTEATALTAAGKTVGTYAYMAPEQIQSGPAISRKTDLYALGCLLYELLVGETPFQSENPMDMLLQHLNDDPYNVCEKVPNCPIWLDRLIEQMLAKNPDDRPYDALAVHTQLGEIREKALKKTSVTFEQHTATGVTSNSAKTEGAEKKKKKKKKRKKKEDVPFHEQTWFLSLCLLALIGATTWLLLPHNENWYVTNWQAAMEQSAYDQKRSLENHVDLYLENFPDGQFSQEAQLLSDRWHAFKMEPLLKNLAKFDKPVESEFKAACVKARQAELDEDLYYVSPWDAEWQQESARPLQANPLPCMIRWHILSEQGKTFDTKVDENRWLQNLCMNHHEYFRRRLLKSEKIEVYLTAWMKTAEELAADNQLGQATAIWNYTRLNFQKVERRTDYYNYARQRYNGISVPVPQPRNGSVQSTPVQPVPLQDSSGQQDQAMDAAAKNLSDAESVNTPSL